MKKRVFKYFLKQAENSIKMLGPLSSNPLFVPRLKTVLLSLVVNIDTRTKVTKEVLPTNSIQSKINDPIVISCFNITSPVKTVEILLI